MSKIRVKPIFDGDAKMFVIQEEKTIWGLRYWSDVRNISGYPVICNPEEVQGMVTHLSRVQEI